MEEKDLKKLRNQIDSIDDEILNLIVKRSSIVDQIGIIGERFFIHQQTYN